MEKLTNGQGNKVLRIQKYNDEIFNKTLSMIAESAVTGVLAINTCAFVSGYEFINDSLSSRQKVIISLILSMITAILGFLALKSNSEASNLCQAKLRLEELNLPPYL